APPDGTQQRGFRPAPRHLGLPVTRTEGRGHALARAFPSGPRGASVSAFPLRRTAPALGARTAGDPAPARAAVGRTVCRAGSRTAPDNAAGGRYVVADPGHPFVDGVARRRGSHRVECSGNSHRAGERTHGLRGAIVNDMNRPMRSAATPAT